MKYKFISSFLIIVVITTSLGTVSFSPPPANASVKSGAVSFVGCFAGSVAAGYLTPLIQKKIADGINSLMINISKMAEGPMKNFLAGLLSKIIPGASTLGIGTYVPVQDQALINAMNNNMAYYVNNETRNAIITRCVAWAIMNSMTNNIMDVVRTRGREGGVTFVQNWTNFQTNAQYRGENIFRAELSTAKLCDYLSADVKKAYGVDPKIKTPITGQNTRTNSLQTFGLATQCTLPTGFTPQKYQQDFAGNGGWDTFARLMEPQNNIYGLTMLSLDEAQKQRALAESADVNQVLANNGYVGISGNGKADSCKVMGPTGQCLTFKDIKTTGNYLAQNIGATIGAQFSWLTSAQGLNTIISDATEVMLNRLLDFGNSDEGSYHPANDSGNNITLTLPTDTTSPTPGTTSDPCLTDPNSCPEPPPDAQTKHPDQSAVVATVKTTLAGQGVDLSGACGAFEITKRVAWQLRDSGAGLLQKPSGSNCQNFATDIIAFPDGYIYDILGDGGGTNGPQWSPSSCGTTQTNGTCPDRYSPAFDPSTGNGTSTSNSGPVNLGTATILNTPATDVASWAQTATITSVDISGSAIAVNFDKRSGSGKWPDVVPPGWDGSIFYTIWIFENINGQWYGTAAYSGYKTSGWETGDPNSSTPIETQIPQNLVYFVPIMASHQLQSGEQVGFMVTAGGARFDIGTVGTLRERSNVFLTTLP